MNNRCLDWRVGLVGHNSYWEGNNYCQQTFPLLPIAEVQFSDAKRSQDCTKKSDISSFISLLSVYSHPSYYTFPQGWL